jgi:hypothetical protein
MRGGGLIWLVAILLGCGGGPTAAGDGGGSDGPRDCRWGADAGAALGLIDTGDACDACGVRAEDGNAECQAQYEVGDGCFAYCKDGLCLRHCDGECRLDWFPEGCAPGDGTCHLDSGVHVVCDPTCGAAGVCRWCYRDEECEAELGATARCQSHCGTCCRPGDGYGPGELPCSCI